MRSLDWRKNIEDSIKDGLIITATTTRIFFVLKAANVKPPKSISRCPGYHEFCWRNMWIGINKRLCNLQEIDQQKTIQKFYSPQGL